MAFERESSFEGGDKEPGKPFLDWKRNYEGWRILLLSSKIFLNHCLKLDATVIEYFLNEGKSNAHKVIFLPTENEETKKIERYNPRGYLDERENILAIATHLQISWKINQIPKGVSLSFHQKLDKFTNEIDYIFKDIFSDEYGNPGDIDWDRLFQNEKLVLKKREDSTYKKFKMK